MLYTIRFIRSPHQDGLKKWPSNDARDVIQAQVVETVTGAVPEFFEWSCPMVWPDRYIISARFLSPLSLDEIEITFEHAIRAGLEGAVEIKAQTERFDRLVARN